MKAILVIDIPDEVWKNKEKDLGMYVELWSERIDKDWYCKYFSDSLKPMPEKKGISLKEAIGIKCSCYSDGWNDCVDEILGEEK